MPRACRLSERILATPSLRHHTHSSRTNGSSCPSPCVTCVLLLHRPMPHLPTFAYSHRLRPSPTETPSWCLFPPCHASLPRHAYTAFGRILSAPWYISPLLPCLSKLARLRCPNRFTYKITHSIQPRRGTCDASPPRPHLSHNGREVNDNTTKASNR